MRPTGGPPARAAAFHQLTPAIDTGRKSGMGGTVPAGETGMETAAGRLEADVRASGGDHRPERPAGPPRRPLAPRGPIATLSIRRAGCRASPATPGRQQISGTVRQSPGLRRFGRPTAGRRYTCA
ncbi:hypothetical protein [Streptosporangium roseum]|uniref:hypothetical protein n=1 Tax=Streptosporangium roseum TaxID=2001 RepID=UPI0004CD935C|nr:hypothetical protein [Streptosporangium roseum]